jgi:hypothetical protein
MLLLTIMGLTQRNSRFRAQETRSFFAPKIWFMQQEFVRENLAIQKQYVADSIRLTSQQRGTLSS